MSLQPRQEERVGSWWEKVLIGVLVLMLGIFLTVLFCGSAEKFILQLFGLGESQKYEALKFLGIGMGGVLLALQALIANKRAKAMEGATRAQAKATEHQAQANKNTEQGQRQERLKNAIEHLGHASDSVRLGGAYELFHLAEDTKDRGQRQTMLDILCAHIRWTTGDPEYRGMNRSKPSQEIQSLLTLLFVQEHQVFTGLHINLQETWLRGSDLSQAHLEGAVLFRAQLHEADLRYARLHGASLVGARLHRTYLEGAQLHGADLMGAQLYGASLWHARLYGASLWDARLHEVELVSAQLRGAFSTSTKAWGESFEESINGQIDQESKLSGARFAGGLTVEDVAFIEGSLSEEGANLLHEKLVAHIGKPISNKLPENSGAITGKYTKEEAAQWIAEYKTATSAVSGSG